MIRWPLRDARRIRRILGVAQGSFPFTYLGSPIFYRRKKKAHPEDLIKKISRRILGWKNMLLSYEGRYILISSVLQSMPIYLMLALNPLKGVTDHIHRILAKFFWGHISGVKGKHWVAW